MQIPPMGGELFHVEGQTGMAKLIVAFRNFADAPACIRTSTYENSAS